MLGCMHSDQQPYLSVTEAAEYARSGVSTMRAWIRENRVRAFRIGRRLFIKKSDLERLMLAQPVAASGGAR